MASEVPDEAPAPGGWLMSESVRAIEIEMADPEHAAAFYADVWHLSEVARHDGAIYLRGTSALRHIVAIHQNRGSASVRRVVFDASDRARVDAPHGKIAATGLALEDARTLERAGGGYASALKMARVAPSPSSASATIMAMRRKSPTAPTGSVLSM